jgi:asparaginyl-tRNA synthetase
MYIKDLHKFEGEIVKLRGWVANKRESKTIVFLNLRDGSGVSQCIASLDELGEENFSETQKLTLESSVEVEGKVVKDERQLGGYEIHASNVNVIQVAQEYPISNKEHGVDFLMDNRHLWLRSQRQWAIMRVRSTIVFAIHKFFQKEGFVQMDAPVFTGNACEGTTDLFESEFYGEVAYLSQSGQLYGEAMAMAMGKIYTFGPTFRAEKSKTRRHLSEFWMIEPEMAFYDIFQNMDLIEDFLQYVINEVIENCEKELGIIDRDMEALKTAAQPFVRLTYDEAVSLLKGEQDREGRNSIKLLEVDLEETISRIAEVEKDIAERETLIETPGTKKGVINFNKNKIGQLKNELTNLKEAENNIPQWLESARTFEYGNDFGGSDETVLTRLFEVPVMVYDWPHAVKAFYLKRNPEDTRFARGVDVLAPEGYGEIVGGGERETDEEWLKEKIVEHELPMEEFEWYLDLRRYGSVPHSGFGLGLERLVAWICKLPHVRETIPFPRMYGRLKP